MPRAAAVNAKELNDHVDLTPKVPLAPSVAIEVQSVRWMSTLRPVRASTGHSPQMAYVSGEEHTLTLVTFEGIPCIRIATRGQSRPAYVPLTNVADFGE